MLNFVKKVIKHILLRPLDNDALIRKYRENGVMIGDDVHIINSTIDEGHGFLVEIGNHVTITGTTILTHDASIKIALGYCKVGKVIIGDEVFIGIGSIVLPNVRIGSKVIIGAGTVVAKDVPSNSVMVGNPMRRICSYEEYIQRHREAMAQGPKYETYWPDKTADEIQSMKQALDGIIGYDP